MPKLTGRQTIIGFLINILPMVKGIRLKQHIVEGDYVATLFDMETVNGVDHVFDRIHIIDGKIQGVHAFYYPQLTPEALASLRTMKVTENETLGAQIFVWLPDTLARLSAESVLSPETRRLPFRA
jgi:hypothetical protein